MLQTSGLGYVDQDGFVYCDQDGYWFETFSESKRELIKRIDQKIALLKMHKKKITETRKADVQ